MRYSRALFATSAAVNFVVAIALVFLRAPVFAALKLDPAVGTNAVLATFSGALVAAFGYAYVRVAIDPARFREYVSLAIVGKSIVFASLFVPWLLGRADARGPLLGLPDAAFALLFADWLRRHKTGRTRSEGEISHGGSGASSSS